jgi:hypothetical protein
VIRRVIFRIWHWQLRMNTSTCWSCGAIAKPYEIFPAATFAICHFRCDACEVEWTAALRIDNADQLPGVQISNWDVSHVGLTT